LDPKIVSLNSTPTNIKEGIKTNTKKVAANNPNTIVIAIGFKNCACKLLSNKRGVSPAIVVKDVNNTALNLS
tara:strand:+ start:401 stop:616 length:216 start_codon:yes stop_codon:yes gene_type:complete